MPETVDYSAKFRTFSANSLYRKLPAEQQRDIRRLSTDHLLTFQEFRQVVEASRDLTMWGEGNLDEWWRAQLRDTALTGRSLKKHILKKLNHYLDQLRNSPKVYPENGLPRPRARQKLQVATVQSNKKIHGLCPVASPETVCCNLKTIDAVENCAFGCSYCTIQTFYQDQFVFEADLSEKLKAIPIDPAVFYHFGTGQSSDSLVWGNKNGNLDTLCRFAAQHPNILLEFKTKSDNIHYFLENKIPHNVVCSWSLNTPTIIQSEEHFTASLDERIGAARAVADLGVKVAFHFHPMVYYADWQLDYAAIATRLLQLFQPDEVLFISFGSVTMITPAIKKIRELGQRTKILQMQMVRDPHGKLTYPDETKIAMFRTMHQALAPWQESVFMYLCMEKASIWQETFGFAYSTNDEFERQFGLRTMNKLVRTDTHRPHLPKSEERMSVRH